MMNLTHIKEGIRIFNSSRRIKAEGYDHIDGAPKEICSDIVRSCWNGRFFMTSNSNFSQFWTRDFGWSTGSLLEMGCKVQVDLTLRYALDIFKRYNRVTTTITPDGIPYDFPNYSIDSLPFLLFSIRKSGFDIFDYKDFLDEKIEEYEKRVYDLKTGLVKRKYFSSIKDYSKRICTTYACVMLASLARDAEELGLHTHLDYDKIRSKIFRTFWNGSYFFEDIRKKPAISSDANIFPFFMEIFTDRKMIKNSMESMIYAGLDDPLPLIYSRQKDTFIWQEVLVKNYEKDTVWAHIGMLFICILSRYDSVKAAHYFKQYADIISRYGNFLEVYDKKLNPFSTFFYTSDQSMLWASIFVELSNIFDKQKIERGLG